MRPFSELAQVSHCSYSTHLQRVICDFGADHAFGQVSLKLEEHYGIRLAESAARLITELHANRLHEQDDIYQTKQPNAEVIVAESDGSMVPIVETLLSESEETGKVDRRKKRTVFWKEARLSLAHAQGSTTPCFAGTLESVETAGKQLLKCVEQAGAYTDTKVHSLGDGAPWIAHQVETHFGSNGHYLIDFYHVCDYFAAAAPFCAKGHEKAWMEEQKSAMKLNQYEEVLHKLSPFIEPATVENKNAPVRACYRYLKNRPEQLNYKDAIDSELPIGSGEIESAHRYVLQKRLKLSGAWWKINHAKSMISLRICRANNRWKDYWQKTG